MVWCEWSTMSTEREDGSAKVRWAINDMFLAWFIDVSEKKIVEGSADNGMGVTDFLGPQIKDLPRPWRDVAYNF